MEGGVNRAGRQAPVKLVHFLHLIMMISDKFSFSDPLTLHPKSPRKSLVTGSLSLLGNSQSTSTFLHMDVERIYHEGGGEEEE